jgi:glycosyltransferase involved in cell wall biosynthesis
MTTPPSPPTTITPSSIIQRPVSIITVSYDTYFFTRLLAEKVREHIGTRPFELIVVDRGSTCGSREWLTSQSDVRLIRVRQWRSNCHHHGEALEKGIASARHEYVAVLDSDAHPVNPFWLRLTIDRLDKHNRVAGAEFWK